MKSRSGRSLLLLLVFHLAAHAQQPKKFEVASVKLNLTGDTRSGADMLPGGRFAATNVTLESALRVAFGVQSSQILGIPDWARTARYDIEATTGLPARLTQEEVPPLLVALIEDRFKLTFHRETRKLDAYSLLQGKSGAKLTEHSGGGDRGTQTRATPESISMRGTKVTMGDLVTSLGRRLDAAVVDNTGLKGEYDLALDWSPNPGVDNPGPTLFTAVQEQLGLRLEARKTDVEVIVIDAIERLSAN